jgi:hypothetical protein
LRLADDSAGAGHEADHDEADRRDDPTTMAANERHALIGAGVGLGVNELERGAGVRDGRAGQRRAAHSGSDGAFLSSWAGPKLVLRC